MYMYVCLHFMLDQRFLFLIYSFSLCFAFIILFLSHIHTSTWQTSLPSLRDLLASLKIWVCISTSICRVHMYILYIYIYSMYSGSVTNRNRVRLQKNLKVKQSNYYLRNVLCRHNNKCNTQIIIFLYIICHVIDLIRCIYLLYQEIILIILY